MAVSNVLQFFKVGKEGVSPRPTILVMSPAGFTDHLKEALLTENKQLCSDMFQFIFCESIEHVLSWTSNNQHHLPSVDYVVIVLDPRENACINTAEENISRIDPIYIRAGRLCFVNGACSINPAEMGIPLGHINVVSQKYSVMLINGDVLKPEKCLYLAERIVRLATVVVGINSGVPMSVDIPGYF